MRDDQRPDRDQRRDDIRERFDEALDELFGASEEEQSAGQTPQPPAEEAVPERAIGQPREHEQHPPHELDDRHVLGPGNTAPPSSYGMPTRPTSVQPEQSEPPTMSAGGPATQTHTPTPTISLPGGRNWRRLGCYGCLVLVGVPALCLTVLLVIGLVVGDDEATPTPVAEVGDAPAIDATSQESAGDAAEPFATIATGRPQETIEIAGSNGYGSREQPIPLGHAGPLGGGWELRIDAVIENANAEIAEANMFNEPPAEGRQFVIARVTARNTSEAPAIFDALFRLRLVAPASGSVYTTFKLEDYCGVVPDMFPDAEIAPGEQLSGNVCWQVRSEDVDHLVLYSDSMEGNDNEIWFALTGPGTSAGNAP